MNNSSILNSKLFKISLICAFFLLAGIFPKFALSQEKTTEGQEKKFDAKETILEHIGDSHSWPVFGEHTLPLPVILYTDKGIETFSSKKLDENHVYTGKYYSYKLAGINEAFVY